MERCFEKRVITVNCNSWECIFLLLLISCLWFQIDGGEDRPGLAWKETTNVKRRKAKKYIQKKEKNKDDKNDNKNKMTIWDRLGWVKEKSPVCQNVDGFKQYYFTNCNVTLRK